MRKIFLIPILLLGFLFTKAQTQPFPTVAFNPATFTGKDNVILTVDLSGTPMAGAPAVYVWTWANKNLPAFPVDNNKYPGKDGIYNDNWGSQTDNAKMTNIGGNKWQWAFKPVDLYGLTAGQLKQLQLIFKSKDGSLKAYPNDSDPFAIAPIEYVPNTYRLFPYVMDQNDAITVYFYQNLSTDLTESRMTPTTITLKAYNGATQFGSNVILPIKTVENQLFSAAFIPAKAWTIPAGTTLTSFTYTVNGTSFDTNGNVINVSGTTKTRVFDILK